MKTKKCIVLVIFSLVLSVVQSQTLEGIVNTATGVVKGGNLSNDEIIKGLKEALKVGATNSVSSASKLDGFFKNVKIKIPFPSEAKSMETKLRGIGMGKECDQFIETLNRGAEEAAKSALSIFADAITNINISDGVKILNGADNAATLYLRDNTQTALKSSFLPIVKLALEKVEVTKYWTPLTTAYNKIPFVSKVNPDLNAYVTDKGIDGLFTLIADEEYKIRKDPKARINDILKNVFGGK